jgi:hypothetical protein
METLLVGGREESLVGQTLAMCFICFEPFSFKRQRRSGSLVSILSTHQLNKI